MVKGTKAKRPYRRQARVSTMAAVMDLIGEARGAMRRLKNAVGKLDKLVK